MTQAERRGDWCQTFTGRAVYPLDMRPEDVDIRDIAHSLSLQCRFNGHCKVFYSVAEHSVNVVAWLVENHSFDELALFRWGLMHDAAEAYFSDVPRPVKRSMPGWTAIESDILTVIANRFCLALPIPEEVVRADGVLLATEARDFMAPPPRAWGLVEKPWARDLRFTIETQPAIEHKFLSLAVDLRLVTCEEAGI